MRKVSVGRVKEWGSGFCRIFVVIFGGLIACGNCLAQSPSTQDILVLSNGDTLHGRLVSSIQGKVTFHSDVLGDISLTWDKIKELQTVGQYAVIGNSVSLQKKKEVPKIPVSRLDVKDQTIAASPELGQAPMPTKSVAFILDQASLDKELHHQPSLLAGWNGAATAGATLVTATQHQYAFSGGVGLVRVVPTVSWLRPRDRTSIDFGGSFGKITQPAYVVGGTPVPSVSTKSALYHADAERDEYLSSRLYVLVQAAFDHNYGQDLDLQQIYGGGLGYTILRTAKQEADVKATVQYEKQQFISGGSSPNLIGSTVGGAYIRHSRLFTFTQAVAFIPAYNDPHAYSANETDTLAFPTYKNLGFSVGTLDSYLNDPPVSEPPTKRNSFQFTMGLTYAIKSKY